MSNQTDTMTGTRHLQGLGRCAAKRADALAVGDVTIWNGGAEETIKSIARTSPQYVTAVVATRAGEFTRRLKIDRMVAVASD